MRREGRGGKSRQYPIAPPLAGGRFFFILLVVGLASAILIGRITLLQVIDRPFCKAKGTRAPCVMKPFRRTAV